MDSVLTEAVTRVQRRRPDVKFMFRADPWIVDANRAALSRAPSISSTTRRNGRRLVVWCG
ncbi:hypothetical protein QYQ98_08955 [Corynebacterium sp. P3-F1]|uniref:hypothetical protein n=1 Tax=Corynebacterium sp. P3-F1 TaxID=3059080 RepID=UPI00265D49B9|nr:hypothetical protein [Corynebacterium sp. P3-F1]WKK61135.1 hypothetical protein QYQ98_08955 [Corynebacterium sp. P3-F1]